MKKILICFNIIIMVAILLSSSHNVYAKNDSDEQLRIGLRKCYEHKDVIHANNKKMNMGYETDKKFELEQTFVSDDGFDFLPATDNYLVTMDNFKTYTDAMKQAHVLMKKGQDAYPGYSSIGVWKLYIKIKDMNNLSQFLEELELDENIAYEIVKDDGLRTKMEFSSDTIIIENTSNYIQFQSFEIDKQCSIIDLGDRKYRGRMEFSRFNEKGITAINVIALNEYLYGVLASEVPYNWPMEALKAQAVAARNYAVYYKQNNNKYKNKPYILCDTTSSQAYKGYGVENERTNKAVDETNSRLITYKGEVIQATFFSTSGGHTENSEDVWNGSMPFLKGVPDIYELEPAVDPWSKEMTSTEIKDVLVKYDVNIGDIIDVIPLEYTDSKRVTNLKIIGTTGEYTIKKETIRFWLGLRSRKFTVVKENYKPREMYNVISAGSYEKVNNINNMYVATSLYGKEKLKVKGDQLIVLSKHNIDNIPLIKGKKDTYIFMGQGYGHGVGMSQSGAKSMANLGFAFEEILKYYYTDIEIK